MRLSIHHRCFEVEYVVHEVSDTVGDDDSNLEASQIAIDHIEWLNFLSLHASVDPMVFLVVVATNFQLTRTNHMPINIIVLKQNNQCLARFDLVNNRIMFVPIVFTCVL